MTIHVFSFMKATKLNINNNRQITTSHISDIFDMSKYYSVLQKI